MLQLDGAQSLDERLETTNIPTGDNDRGAMMHLDIPGKDKGLLLLTGGHHATEAGDQPDVSIYFPLPRDGSGRIVGVWQLIQSFI